MIAILTVFRLEHADGPLASRQELIDELSAWIINAMDGEELFAGPTGDGMYNIVINETTAVELQTMTGRIGTRAIRSDRSIHSIITTSYRRAHANTAGFRTR